jgi:MFS family permease
MINQFTVNAAFYMLMPYLANHLAGGLGLAGWAVGLVLGVRNLSQQGLFLLGGALADRYGCKPMIVAGCALRTLGFGLLIVASSLPALVLASAATGFAGALFNPATRTYLARESGEDRVRVFATFNVFYQAGMCVGPIVGLALLGWDFKVVCAVAAALFLGLTVVQSRCLPKDPAVAERPPGIVASWREVLRNRAFVRFAVAMTGAYVLSFQVYLALPLQAHRLTGAHGDALTTGLFAVSALVAVGCQLRLTAWARTRLSPIRAVAAGAAVTGLAFVPLVLPSVPTLLLATAVLAIGSALAYPFEMDTVVRMANDRLVATHYGLYNTICGIGITTGTLATGALWDAAGGTALPWLVFVLVGLACAVAVSRLEPRG